MRPDAASGPVRAPRWRSRPLEAALLRLLAFALPIAASVVFVHLASRFVPRPGGLVPLVAWWVVLSGSATVVLIAVDRLARRLLPLAALLRLSLVFPDEAPSRFDVAMRTRTVDTLADRLRSGGTEADGTETPAEAAQRLLQLVAALDDHDRITRGHSERVRAYAQMIGEELGLDDHDVDLLNWAALVHDVGKLEVAGEILNNPGRPSDEQWQALRRHPELGDDLVRPLRGWLGEWADAVAQHHERWDGRGYPHGLADDRISLAARIVAVADVFDVVTSARSYKEPQGAVQGREEIARNAGTQFDPHVVRAFLNISLGRLRLAMGPLSWLAHAPILGRIPLGPAVSTATSAVAAVAVAAVTGLAGQLVPPTPHIDGANAAHPAPSSPGRGAPAPVAAAALARETPEDTRLTLDLLRGTRATSARIVGKPAEGAAALRRPGTLVYTPAPDFHGRTSLRYALCGGGGCAEAALRIVVTPVNDAPTAADDAVSAPEDTPVVVHPLANDADPDGDTLGVASVAAVSAGAAEADGTTVRWTPPRDFSGVASIAYVAGDGAGGEARATVTVSVAPVNDAPVAAPDTAATDEDTPVRIPVLANDTDPDGDALAIAAVEADRGTAVADGGQIAYTPPPGFSGEARVRYRVEDGNGGAAEADALVRVAPVNDAPVAVDDRASVDEDGAVTLRVLANDSDPDGAPPRLRSLGPVEHGTARRDGDAVVFTPDRDYSGPALVEYVVADDAGATARAAAHVEVLPVNDAPSLDAVRDVSVAEDAGAQRLPGWAAAAAGPPDESSQALRFEVRVEGGGGLFAPGGTPAVSPSGELTFAPAPDASGSARLVVTARDDGGRARGGADSSPAREAVIRVEPVNDAPSFALAGDVTVEEDAGPQRVAGWASAIRPGPADESGQAVRFAVEADDPSLFAPGGRPALSPSGELTFVPAENANGVARIRVRAIDDGGTLRGGADTSAERGAAIRVAPVNDAPVAAGDAATMQEDAPGGVLVDVLANDSDPDGDPLVAARDDGARPAHGSVETGPGGTLRYVPERDFAGVDAFRYTVSDGNGGTASAVVVVTVEAVNDRPRAADDAVFVPEDGSVSFDVLANDADPDGDPLTVASAAGGGLRGTLTRRGSAFTYAPAPDDSGTERFTYTVRDPSGATDTATVTIVVGAAPDAPHAADDAVSTAEDGPAGVTFDVLANDTDPDGDPLSVSSHGDPAHGTLTANGGGSFTYVPDAGWNGTDGFTYVVSDGHGGTDTGRVTIAVGAVNDPPVAVGDSATVTEDDAAGVTVDVLANDSDPDGDTLTLASRGAPAHGTLTANGGGSLTYVPAADYSGPDSFLYTVSDGNGGTDAARVSITVTAVNDPPVAASDGVSVDEDATAGVTFDVLANDTDPDGDALTVTSHGDPAHGTLTANGGGSFTYVPAPGYNGPDSFLYTVSDGNGGSAAGTVSIAVGPVNDPPSAVDDAATVAEDDSAGATFDVLANDSDPDGDALTVASHGDPAHGTLTANGGGSFTYVPAADYAGPDVLSYTVSDGQGGTATATVSLTVTPVNDAPVAAPDSPSVAEDDPSGVTFDVLANDSDVDGDPLAVASYDASGIANGTLSQGAGGSFTYVPDPAFNGTETFSYVVTDGTATDTGTVAITVTPQPDPPIAGADAYATTQDTTLTVAAPGLLANDADEDGDALTVATTPDTPPAHGALTLAADGSFDYVPDAGWAGTDTFTYRVADGTGLSSTATVTITVDSSLSAGILYLQPGPPTATEWPMTGALPPAAAPVPDTDGDALPGLTIRASGGDWRENDPRKYHDWVADVTAPLTLNGPVRLQLWSTTALYELDKAVHPHVYLYECAPGGVSCVELARNDVHVDRWNGLVASWVYHEVTVGSVARVVGAGRELRVKLLVGHHDVWVATTAGYPSALSVTLGG